MVVIAKSRVVGQESLDRLQGLLVASQQRQGQHIFRFQRWQVRAVLQALGVVIGGRRVVLVLELDPADDEAEHAIRQTFMLFDRPGTGDGAAIDGPAENEHCRRIVGVEGDLVAAQFGRSTDVRSAVKGRPQVGHHLVDPRQVVFLHDFQRVGGEGQIRRFLGGIVRAARHDLEMHGFQIGSSDGRLGARRHQHRGQSESGQYDHFHPAAL